MKTAAVILSPSTSLRVNSAKNPVGVLRLLIVILFVVASLAACSPRICSAESAYRIVSSVKEGGRVQRQHGIARRVAPADSNKLSWREIASHPWIPAIPESLPPPGESFLWPATVDDGELPPVPAILEIKAEETVRLSRENAVLCTFDVRGGIGERGDSSGDDVIARRLGDIGARSVSIEGDGMFLVDAKGRRPLAGRMHLTRRISPALWRTGGSDAELTAEVDTAWAIIP